MIRGGSIVLAFGLAAWSSGVVAQSDAELPEAYVLIKGGAAVVGTLSGHNDAYSLTQADAARPIVIPEVENQSDLETSFGAEAQYVFSLHRYVGLGGLFGVRTWKSDASAQKDEGTSFNFDLGVAPQFRLPLSERFELYVSVPLAIVLSVLREPKTWSELRHMTLGTSKNVSPTYGFGLGVLAGARFALSGSFGVLAEVGYQRYAFTHSVQFQILSEIDSMGLGTSLDVDLVSEQLRIHAGVFF